MTTENALRRRGQAVRLLLLAGLFAVIAAVTLAIQSRSISGEAGAGPVIPGLAEIIGDGQRITIASAEASYGIERSRLGEDAVWVMSDRGDYPVLAARLRQLTEGLESLTYVRRMTSDPSKHERLGVGDPREGGRGVLVQIEDGRGAYLVNLILGVEPGGLYVRRPDDNQTWSVRGELPPLRDVASWLDLRPLGIDPDVLARVEITPSEGRGYVLARDNAESPWRIAAPAVPPLAQSTLVSTAEMLTQLSPVDVQPAPAIQGAPAARVRALTFDEMAIEAELIESDGRLWIKAVVLALTPEQEEAALALNDRAAPWAYGLRDLEARALAPPLRDLLPGSGEIQ